MVCTVHDLFSPGLSTFLERGGTWACLPVPLSPSPPAVSGILHYSRSSVSVVTELQVMVCSAVMLFMLRERFRSPHLYSPTFATSNCASAYCLYRSSVPYAAIPAAVPRVPGAVLPCPLHPRGLGSLSPGGFALRRHFPALHHLLLLTSCVLPYYAQLPVYTAFRIAILYTWNLQAGACHPVLYSWHFVLSHLSAFAGRSWRLLPERACLLFTPL